MRFLVIQTAFLGDVILATSVVETLHAKFPDAKIDFLLKKGTESVLENNPLIYEILLLDKEAGKLKNLFALAKKVRGNKYDQVINLNRFGSSGFIAWRSGAKEIIGFDKNPFSFSYTKKIKHEIGNGKHEVERNNELIKHLTSLPASKPKLYPSPEDANAIHHIIHYPLPISHSYVCIAPASVWFTKQFPKEKWIEFIHSTDASLSICLIGGKDDFNLCEEIKSLAPRPASRVLNLAGKLSILETAALMQGAKMNYVNDSAPMHIASAMNAPVTAIYCSTVPAFGFGPLSDNSKIIETKEKLDCRPCGIHGHKTCPKGHFKCAYTIEIKDILNA